eukprot:105644_1
MATRGFRLLGITTTGIVLGSAAYYNRHISAKTNVTTMSKDEYDVVKKKWNNQPWIKKNKLTAFAPFDQPSLWDTIIEGYVMIQQQMSDNDDGMTQSMSQTIWARFEGLEPLQEYSLEVCELDNINDRNILGPYKPHFIRDKTFPIALPAGYYYPWFGKSCILKSNEEGIAFYNDTQSDLIHFGEVRWPFPLDSNFQYSIVGHCIMLFDSNNQGIAVGLIKELDE